jgi:hypothetical protein
MNVNQEKLNIETKITKEHEIKTEKKEMLKEKENLEKTVQGDGGMALLWTYSGFTCSEEVNPYCL